MIEKKNLLILVLSAILVISVMPVSALDSNWQQFQKDEINTGITYSSAPTEDPELAWSAFTASAGGNGIDVTPIITGDMVYVYAANGSIWAFDKTNGDLIWKNETTGGNLQTSTPAYGDGKIFVAANSGDLFAFNATTGEELWKVHVTDGNFECPITYFDHKIYIGEGLKGGVTTKYYYCYDDNGTFVWKYAVDNTSGFLWCGASVVGDYLVFPTYEGRLISLYKNNGTLTDEVDLTSELSFSRHDLGKIRASVTYHDGYIYTTSEKGQPVGYVFKVRFDNGTFVDDGWSTAIGFSTSTPVVYDGKVYVGQGEHGFTGNLTCIDDSSGEIIWSYFVDAGVKSSPAISIQEGKSYIYFTTAKNNGSLYCLTADGTLAWEYNPPDDGYVLQGAAISEGKVYFGTDGGYIYCLKKKPPTTIYVPDDYSRIQWAVDNATAGNTIIVRDGTYIENVDVNKRLTIRSENGSDSTVVQVANPNDNVFYVTADYVNISGFTVEGAKEGCRTSGVYLSYGKHCNIHNNKILDNRRGIFLVSSNCNTIANNTIDNISTGIWFEGSSNNIITNNTVLKIVRTEGMQVYGFYLCWSSGNIITNNNLITSGIFVHMANDNKIYLNNLYARSMDATNIWNSTSKIIYSYEGKTYTNYTGNYWGSDYTGSDTNVDGIGDTPYIISAEDEDNYPLVEKFENYHVLAKTDLMATSLQPTTLYLQTNTITATISNIGEADAGEFNVSLSANGTVVDTVGVSGLTAGSSTTVSFTWTPSELGSYELCVLADCDDSVLETDETNNEYCENVTIEEPEPDLAISKITLKTPGYVGEENTLGITVENIGAKNAGSFTVTLAVDGTQLGEQNIPSLDAWTSTELEFAWTPSDIGRHELTATADSKDEIEESDETNNNLTRTFVIITKNDWAQFHYDDTHVGFSPSKAPNTNETLWISEDIGAVPSSSTVVAEGKVFVNCGDSLTALNEYTGEVLWSSPAGVGGAGGSWSSPAYHDGKAFINGEGAYSAADGSKIWDGLPGNTNGGPLVANGRVFIGDWDGHHYYCFDEENGEELWNFTVSGYAQGTPAFADGKVFLTSWPYGSGGYVYCVDSTTGAEIWSTHTNSEACGSPTVSVGIVYVTTYGFYGPGEIYALNTTDGSILWQKTIQRTDSTPSVAYGNVYVCGGCPGFSDLQTYCFNATTGDLVWETTASEEGIGSWTCSVAVADGKVFVGKMSGTGMSFDYAGTYALDAFTGDIIWSYPEGGSSPAVADGMVFTIGDGKVYAFGTAPSIPPNIISWNPVKAIVNDTEGVASAARTFNITIDQTVNVSWQINGTEVQTNISVTEASYTNTSAAVGTWNVSAIAVNENGTAMQTWLWIVHPQDTNPPESIVNLTNVTGNFWINWTWDNPSDADFNYTVVYINGTFETNTSIKYFNLTNLSPHATKTISTHTVDASGNVNETWVNQTTTIPNNVPVLEAIGDKNIDEEETLTIDVNASDFDDDTLRYSCNRTDLFSDFNTTTGVGSWTPQSGDAGVYYVDFGVSDGHGGINNETIKITVNDKTPPASITNLANTTGNFWINWTWTNPADADFNYTMVYINGTLVENVSKSTPYYNATYTSHATRTVSTHTVDIAGNVNSTWINQTTAIPNNVPVLEAIGDKTVEEGEKLTIDANATDLDLDSLTYSCNKTDLFTDFNTTTGEGNWTPQSGDAGIYYVDFGVSDGYGGINNETVQITVNDVTPPASITNLANTTGNFWINWKWDNPPDADFNYTVVYINGAFETNTSIKYFNLTNLRPHATKTISTHTVDTSGNVNETWVNQTTAIPNNVPVLDTIGNKTVDESQTVTIDVNATDIDSDTLTYSCNRTDLFADFNRTTGIGSWTPSSGQAGTYYVDFGVADGYGGVDNETVRITVNDVTPPATITNLQNATGNFWINWTWINPIDDDYSHVMVYVEGIRQANISKPLNYYNETYTAHTTKTISTHTVDIAGNINSTWVNQTTTVPNNAPVLEDIGNKEIKETETLIIDANASDLDNDTLTYSCNRTDLFTDFNSTTGVGDWTPISGQAGDYYVNFGVSDGHDGIDNETVKIAVYDRTPPASISNLSYTNGTTWINWTWMNPSDADFNYTMVYLNGTWKTNTSLLFYNATDLDPDTCYEIETRTVDTFENINETWVNQTAKTQAESSEKLVFDTGKGTYPSIFGTHKGKIILDKDIMVSKMYTYPCEGTGGHSEYVKIWNESGWNVSASWNGYKGDWHNVSFSKSFTLKGGETYYYEIKTGSYPQIIHEHRKTVTGGTITCDKFIDANGKIYNDWIPAIRLYF